MGMGQSHRQFIFPRQQIPAPRLPVRGFEQKILPVPPGPPGIRIRPRMQTLQIGIRRSRPLSASRLK